MPGSSATGISARSPGAPERRTSAAASCSRSSSSTWSASCTSRRSKPARCSRSDRPGRSSGRCSRTGWARRLGLGTAIVSTAVVFSFGGLAFPLAPKSFPLPLLMAGQLLFGFSAIAYNILQVSYRQAITPERLQGRMNAAMRWIVWGTIPLGTLAGGAIAQTTSLHTALWVGALLGTPTFLWVLLSPLRSVREIPAAGRRAHTCAGRARGRARRGWPTGRALRCRCVDRPAPCGRTQTS